jgi:F0F1-type ATP synthase membrane subunit c/vacuolar-type H+-ATPase subunit K
MSDPHLNLLGMFVAIGAGIAFFAAAIAAAANRKWPERTVQQITTFSVFALVVGFFVLTIAWMLWLTTAPCPARSVCDAGAMAAAGVIMLGAMGLIAALAVGAPVAYFTVRALRAR